MASRGIDVQLPSPARGHLRIPARVDEDRLVRAAKHPEEVVHRHRRVGLAVGLVAQVVVAAGDPSARAVAHRQHLVRRHPRKPSMWRAAHTRARIERRPRIEEAMKAAILEEFHQPLVVEEVELLPPAPDGAIVRTTASAFCITDCMNQRGELGKKLPTILGHAGVRRRRGGRRRGDARPRRRPRRRARDARVRRLLLVRSAAGPTSAPTLFVPQPPRRQPGERRAGHELGRRRHVRGEDARAARAGSSRSRPTCPTTSSRCSAAGSRPGLGAVLNAAEVEPGLVRGGRRLRPPRALDGAGRARRGRRADHRRRAASRSGGGWPASSARPTSSTRPPATRRAGARADRGPRRRLRARGGRPRRPRRSRRS